MSEQHHDHCWFNFRNRICFILEMWGEECIVVQTLDRATRESSLEIVDLSNVDWAAYQASYAANLSAAFPEHASRRE